MIPATTIYPEQGYRFAAFSRGFLEDLFRCLPGGAADVELPDQLAYIGDYLDKLDCRSVLAEGHYIDRDYIEDFSAFYSRNLYPYPNYCQRIHFFTEESGRLQECLTRITEIGALNGRERYRSESLEYSNSEYLGFMVLKPLGGCPVGRTVIRPLPEDDRAGSSRVIAGVRSYKTHVAGVELTVKGLAFQQQDRGVSACATTAIWSALHKLTQFERVAVATPAQITSVAGQQKLPFGRAMPSDGLNMDQMCVAIQKFGAAPNLLKAEDRQTALSYLHTTAVSGITPILVLQNSVKERGYHAATLVGFKQDKRRVSASSSEIRDRSSEISSIYLHDDRIGPYAVGLLTDEEVETEKKVRRIDETKETAKLKFDIPSYGRVREKTDPEDVWILRQILIPLHPKVRLSVATLRKFAIDAVGDVMSAIPKELAMQTLEEDRAQLFSFYTAILKSVDFLEKSLLHGFTTPAVLQQVAASVVFPRYVATVVFESDLFDRIELLIDSTSSEPNVHFVGVYVPKTEKPLTIEIARQLAYSHQCSLIPTDGADESDEGSNES